MRRLILTNLVWANPLSFDAFLPSSLTLAIPCMQEDEIEDFLLDAYGYQLASFNLDVE